MSFLVILVYNYSLVKYENGVKRKRFIGISNLDDKNDDQSDSKGEDLMNVRSETENQLNSKSQFEAHENVVAQEKTIYKAHKVLKMFKMEKGNLNEMCCFLNKTHTIDAGSDDIVSGYLKAIDDEVQNIDEGKFNEVD